MVTHHDALAGRDPLGRGYREWHPGHGEVRTLGFPIKFTEAPCRLRRPAPDLGVDTGAVLSELGYSPADIARLREAGVV